MLNIRPIQLQHTCGEPSLGVTWAQQGKPTTRDPLRPTCRSSVSTEHFLSFAPALWPPWMHKHGSYCSVWIWIWPGSLGWTDYMCLYSSVQASVRLRWRTRSFMHFNGMLPGTCRVYVYLLAPVKHQSKTLPNFISVSVFTECAFLIKNVEQYTAKLILRIRGFWHSSQDRMEAWEEFNTLEKLVLVEEMSLPWRYCEHLVSPHVCVLSHPQQHCEAGLFYSLTWVKSRV
jgi:hypothetical protein